MRRPLPVLDFSYSALKWQQRIRWNLMTLPDKKLWALLPIGMSGVEVSEVRNELDKVLDGIVWHPNASTAYKNLRDYRETLKENMMNEADRNKFNRLEFKYKLLTLVLSNSFGGVKKHFGIGQWKMYMIDVVNVKDKVSLPITFTAEDDQLAFDWVTEALLSSQEELFDEFKWVLIGMYRCPYNNVNKKVDITSDFWKVAGPLVGPTF